MIKRSFFGCVKPTLKYEIIDESYTEPVSVLPKNKIILFFRQIHDKPDHITLKVGDHVQCGQKLCLTDDVNDYVLPSKSGQISDISTFIGIFGKKAIAVTIDIDDPPGKVADDCFKNTHQTPTLNNAKNFLEGLPGKPRFDVFLDKANPKQTIAVLGIDNDLIGVANQYIVKNSIASVKTGIEILRQITGIHNIILIVFPYLSQVAGSSGVTIKTVDREYPSANLVLIERYLLSQTIGSDDKTVNKNSVAFFTAEAVSAIGAAYNTGRIPLEKIITFVSKDKMKRLISVPLGTPLQDILDAFNETLNDGDRLIVGGPMTGVSVYSADYPVLSDMDTLMVQDAKDILKQPDTPCINCGACIRVCPVKIPVNMLVRYLEAGQFEPARDQYALCACIECGFCAYVCESRIPILQHIRLGKNYLERMNASGSINA